MSKLPSPTDDYFNVDSDRLHFRAFTPEDAASWQAFFPGNPNLRFVGQDDDRTVAEKAETWINRQLERLSKGEFGQLAVCLKNDGRFIGVGGLISRELEDGPVLEITYSLLPSEHGKGLATELARRFIHYGFQHLAQKRLISLIHVENKASMRVAEKNGLQRKNQIEFMGFQVYLYEILREDFLKNQ